MSVKGSIVEPLGLLHVVYQGVIKLDDARREFRRLYTTPAYRAGMPEVCDFSQITELDLGFDEMLSFVRDAIAFHAAQGAIPTICIVATPNSAQHVLDMYADLTHALSNDYPIYMVEGYPEVLALLELSREDLAHFPEFCRREAHLI
ncbi:hypothetical protein NBRC116594_13010 [Shimia sp. NS0008-38b]|uniref:hypothetical protein n=1 Tax=Shimia sp. NS0008-38b TaxID=3127653 RepID=UPI00310A1E5D